MFILRAALAASLALAASAYAADQAMIDAARKEGSAVWYTGLIVNQFVVPAATAFEKKYGVKADYVRADSVDVAVRILNESRAGKMQADVFDGFAAPGLKKQGLVEKWLPDTAAKLQKPYSDPDGQWIATNQFTLTPAFNTNLVPKDQAPKTYQDLLDPKWRGRMAWDSRATSSGGPGFIGLTLNVMGEENGMAYLKQLSDQKIAGLSVAARQVLDQVIAGEYAIGLNMFNHHVPISAAQGAQVAWIPMQPAMGVLSVISLVKNAPHPNAGKLLMDFLTSPDGQAIFREADYLPVDPNVAPKDPSLRPDGVNFKAVYMNPEEIDANMPKWTAVYAELFR
jgi:ABC-type Fe3+ transport system substrate-binding protein